LTKPKGSLWCGVLAFLAALLMLTALIIKIPQLAQHIQLSESPVLDWVFLLAQTIIAIVLTIAAGVCVLLPATRTIGLGALVGLGATASLSLISSVETFYTVTNQGLIVLAAVQLSAYAVVLVVAIIAAVTARRHRAVRSGLRSASRGWLAVVALGAAVTGGSLILHDIQKLYRHSSTAYVVAEDLSIALLGIVVSVGAACTLPRSWSLAMLAGWAGPYGAYLLGKYGELGITHEPGSTAQLVAVIGFGAVAILVPIASESCALKADATHFLPTSKRLEVYWLQQAFALQY